MGICTGLFLIFTTLKLTHYIDWSWVWVLAPLWMPALIFLGLAAIGATMEGKK